MANMVFGRISSFVFFSLLFCLFLFPVHSARAEAIAVPEQWNESRRVFDNQDGFFTMILGKPNYWTGEVFAPVENIEADYSFPERKLIPAGGKTILFLCPSWGYCTVSDEHDKAFIFDGKNNLIFSYENAFTAEKEPYLSIDNFGRTEKVLQTSVIEQATYAIEDNALIFVANPETKFSGEVMIFDDVDVSSVNNGDVCIADYAPNVNLNTIYSPEMWVGVWDLEPQRLHRSLISFTTPDWKGNIVSTTLYLYRNSAGVNTAGAQIELHLLNRQFIETQATWNRYITSATWTNPGGDYSATIEDTSAMTSGVSVWDNWFFAGTEWYTRYDFLLKSDTEGEVSEDEYIAYLMKESTTAEHRPYLEITYTAVSTTPSTADDTRLITIFLFILCCLGVADFFRRMFTTPRN